MEIGKDIEQLLELMAEYSENTLRKPQDLAAILEIAAQSSKADSINLMLLYSSSLWNLYKTAQRQTQNKEILQREIAKSANELSLAISHIAATIDDEYSISRFEQLYYGNEQGSIMNLIDLAHDFDIMKKIQTQAKQSRKNS